MWVEDGYDRIFAAWVELPGGRWLLEFGDVERADSDGGLGTSGYFGCGAE
jgi:hypothetical protein